MSTIGIVIIGVVIRYGESLSLGQAQDRAKLETRHDQPRLSRRVGGWVAKLVTFAASSAGIKGNMSNLFYSLIFFIIPRVSITHGNELALGFSYRGRQRNRERVV